ncbi:hypothetical protein TELCIR_05509 [Teladorsagia circumcincta]|uniref:Uncharacterized protein n=1 Tax=Teladorsagia circumcincta TaxID=45464 RepID=A0A2G9US73_TELCI|nr:hypothetical protein TELCIR_05509 [Teladorsagia circumcincta]
MDNNLRTEFMRRKKCAWSTMGSIKEAAHLISNKNIRADLFNPTVLPADCYASETWAEKNSAMIMTRAQRALEWTLPNINRREKISRNLRSTGMRLMSGIRNAAVYTWDAKKRWIGHVVRPTDDRGDECCEMNRTVDVSMPKSPLRKHTGSKPRPEENKNQINAQRHPEHQDYADPFPWWEVPS